MQVGHLGNLNQTPHTWQHWKGKKVKYSTQQELQYYDPIEPFCKGVCKAKVKSCRLPKKWDETWTYEKWPRGRPPKVIDGSTNSQQIKDKSGEKRLTQRE